jgi:hypothetical protein
MNQIKVPINFLNEKLDVVGSRVFTRLLAGAIDKFTGSWALPPFVLILIKSLSVKPQGKYFVAILTMNIFLVEGAIVAESGTTDSQGFVAAICA